MPILDPLRFTGTLTRGETTIAVGFAAGIDDDGDLTLALDPIVPGRLGTAFAPEGMPLTPQIGLTLRGEAEGGWRFESDTFHVGRWSHPPDRVEIDGSCGMAEFSRAAFADHPDMRAWFFRRLATIHGTERRTSLGRLVFTGYREGADQQPTAVLAIHADRQEPQRWWDETERFLIHLARVLSFACSVYLLPVYEQRVRGGVMTLRVVRRSRAPAAYMPPFDLLYMHPIFDCAVASFAGRPEVVERLDPAIRWMTAPVAYEEGRLLNAMSALESILARSGLPDLFMADPEQFRALRRSIQRVLRQEKAPGRMGGKIAELNRRSFREKLDELISARSIDSRDFPPGWLQAVIDARNALVHTGVAPDLSAPDARLLDHIVWAREIVTRIMLGALGFRGRYQSWLHRSDYRDFPSDGSLPADTS